MRACQSSTVAMAIASGDNSGILFMCYLVVPGCVFGVLYLFLVPVLADSAAERAEYAEHAHLDTGAAEPAVRPDSRRRRRIAAVCARARMAVPGACSILFRAAACGSVRELARPARLYHA